jgi:MFS family permease
MFYAVLSDKLEPRFVKIKAYLAAGQCIGSALCFVAIYYPFISLSFTVVFFAIDFFLFEGFNPLIVSMITMTSPQGAQASVLGLYIIVASLAGLFSAQVINMLTVPPASFQQIQLTLTINTALPSFLASICFFMSGYDYERNVKKIWLQRTNAVSKAIEEVPDFARMTQTTPLDSGLTEEANRLLSVRKT